MNKQEQKRWWMSRDESEPSFYGIHHTSSEPTQMASGFYPSGSLLLGQEFELLFDLRLQKGECKEIERPVLVLKQK